MIVIIIVAYNKRSTLSIIVNFSQCTMTYNVSLFIYHHADLTLHTAGDSFKSIVSLEKKIKTQLRLIHKFNQHCKTAVSALSVIFHG